MSDNLRIAIELDGPQHLADAVAYRRDRRKDRLLQEHGLLVLRFLAEDVAMDLNAVLDAILRAVARERGERGDRAVPVRGTDDEFTERGGAEKAREGRTEIGVPGTEVSMLQQVATQPLSSVVAWKRQEKGNAAIHTDSGEL